MDDKEVFLDDEDFDFIYELYDLWMNGLYVYCAVKNKYKGMGLYSGSLQKLLMCPEKKGRNVVVDHKDGNECNNQKDNLRVCSHKENMQNRKPSTKFLGKDVTSLYKGVYWNTMHLSWGVVITADKARHNKGVFSNELAAANCYNYWALEYFKDFAQPNDCEYMNFEEWNKFRILKTKTSQYHGVSLIEGKWIAQLCHKNTRYVLRGFVNEAEAAIAYNKKALELKGDKAKINIIK